MSRVFVPPVEIRESCVSPRAQGLGYYWCDKELYSPDDAVIARYGETLCPADDGAWATIRSDGIRVGVGGGYIGKSMVAAGNDLDDVKRRTEEWLIDHPEPPN